MGYAEQENARFRFPMSRLIKEGYSVVFVYYIRPVTAILDFLGKKS
jgi:hypothetical protein